MVLLLVCRINNFVMLLRLLLLGVTCAYLMIACSPPDSGLATRAETDPAPAAAPKETPAKVLDPAAVSLLDRAYTAHGGHRFDKAHYAFTFRGKRYNFIAEDGHQIYSRSYQKDDEMVYDGIQGGEFIRTIDGKRQALTKKDEATAFESLNSVIYFATLPYKLRDPAVNLYTAGTTSIKAKNYDVLKVNFDQEGGGVDHDDNFLYWINQETDRIDYLAYDYKTNKGGVRFRSAYNPRIVAGVLFQDYVNYKAPLGTALADLPALYEKGQLEELSRIDTEDVAELGTRN